jgi:peroxiredoxin Q/BCP
VKLELPFHLLSDSDGSVCQRYGVLKEKNMYGKKVIGIERSTFIIDPDGAMARIFRKVKVAGHGETVLKELSK